MNTRGGDGGGGPTSAQLREGVQAFEEAKAGRVGDDLPEIDFQTLALSFFSSALMHLGDSSDPVAEGVAVGEVNLPMARQTIDLLALLQEKTRGNLTAEEERTLDQVLYDLRMRYVEVAKNQ